MELGEQVWRQILARRDMAHSRVIYLEYQSGQPRSETKAEVRRLEADIRILDDAMDKLARDKPPLSLRQARLMLDELPGKI